MIETMIETIFDRTMIMILLKEYQMIINNSIQNS